jgi:hypothetical protein
VRGSPTKRRSARCHRTGLVPGAAQRIRDGAERHSDDEADGEVDDVADTLRKGSSRISQPHGDACANCASDNDIAVFIVDPATLTGEPRRLASVNAIFARNRRGDFRKARFAPGPIVNARGSCTICGGMEFKAQPRQLAPREIPRSPIGALGRNGLGIGAWREQPCRGVDVCQGGALVRDLQFQVADVAADLGALAAKRRNDVWLTHAPECGRGRLEILWRLRHNTANSLLNCLFSVFSGNCGRRTHERYPHRDLHASCL